MHLKSVVRNDVALYIASALTIICAFALFAGTGKPSVAAEAARIQVHSQRMSSR